LKAFEAALKGRCILLARELSVASSVEKRREYRTGVRADDLCFYSPV
jgi:hypothetical protein